MADTHILGDTAVAGILRTEDVDYGVLGLGVLDTGQDVSGVVGGPLVTGYWLSSRDKMLKMLKVWGAVG